jgi:hypothetical protein
MFKSNLKRAILVQISCCCDLNKKYWKSVPTNLQAKMWLMENWQEGDTLISF